MPRALTERWPAVVGFMIATVSWLGAWPLMGPKPQARTDAGPDTVGEMGIVMAGPEPLTVVYEPEIGVLDPRLADFAPSRDLRGRLYFAGSNSQRSVFDAWVSGFQDRCPHVEIQYDAIGSRNAAPALAAGQIPLCVCSRPMTTAERDAFVQSFGYEPVELTPAVTVWAVYVHRDNPVRAISLSELQTIWGEDDRPPPANRDITMWGQLGVPEALGRQGIRLYADELSLRHDPVDVLVGRRRPREGIEFVAGDAVSACERLATQPAGMAYGPGGLRRDYLRPVALNLADGQRPSLPSYQAIAQGRYPLLRRVYLYVHKRPGQRLDPVAEAFVRFIYSRAGQKIAQSDDRCPLSREVAQAALRFLSDD